MNPVLSSVLIAFFTAQLLKVLVVFVSKGKFVHSLFFETGGMPSSHTAIVSSLTFSILFSEGLSALAVLSVVFSAIVLRDAMGVRHSVGMQAKVLNELLEEPLKVSEGHTPLQVLAGFVLGLVVSLAVYYF